MNSSRRCPICAREVPPAEEDRTAPFCSARCRLIDLGNWLGDRYRVPGEPAEPPGEGADDSDGD